MPGERAWGFGAMRTPETQMFSESRQLRTEAKWSELKTWARSWRLAEVAIGQGGGRRGAEDESTSDRV